MTEDTRDTQPLGPQVTSSSQVTPSSQVMIEMLTVDELNALIEILRNLPVTMSIDALMDDQQRTRVVLPHVNLINKLGRMAQQVK